MGRPPDAAPAPPASATDAQISVGPACAAGPANPKAVERKVASVVKKEPRSCSGFLTFILIAMIFVPVILFTVAAFFGALLLVIECDESGGVISGGDADASAADDMCSFYEWFKYVFGNLVALATPLTNVSPESGNRVAEILDLLIGAWSMTIAGVIYGFIGALTFTTAVVHTTDDAIMRRWARLLRRRTEKVMDDLAADASGMDFEEFKSAADTLPIEISLQRLRELFDSHDIDGSGSIDQMEAQGLLNQIVKEEEIATSSSSAIMGDLDSSLLNTRLTEMHAMLSALTEAVRGVDARLASVEAKEKIVASVQTLP